MSLVVLFLMCNKELLYGQNISAKGSLLRLSGCEVVGSIPEELRNKKSLTYNLIGYPF